MYITRAGLERNSVPKISLTQGKVAKVCDCHYDELNAVKWCYSPTGYAVRRVGGIKGVSWDKYGKRWHIQITKDSRRVFSAYSRDLEQAKVIQQKASAKLFGAFAPQEAK